MTAILQELVYDSLVEGAVWPYDRRYIRPPHFHGQIECVFVRSGSAVMYLGTRSCPVSAGQLCWVLPGVPHVMGAFSAGFDMWVVELDADLVSSCWRAARRVSSRGDGNLGASFEDWSIDLGRLLVGRPVVDLLRSDAVRVDESADAVWRAGSPGSARRGLQALAALVIDATLAVIHEARRPSIAHMATCLLLASPTMDRLAVAERLGVSEGFLSRAFQRELAVTFVEQRARTRVAHFLSLLQRQERNLLEAALDAGFGSYSQFHRTFTRVTGTRPRDYLESGRKRLQLLVAADDREPESGQCLELPGAQRHRSPLDGGLPAAA